MAKAQAEAIPLHSILGCFGHDGMGDGFAFFAGGPGCESCRVWVACAKESPRLLRDMIPGLPEAFEQGVAAIVHGDAGARPLTDEAEGTYFTAASHGAQVAAWEANWREGALRAGAVDAPAVPHSGLHQLAMIYPVARQCMAHGQGGAWRPLLAHLARKQGLDFGGATPAAN